MPSSPMVIGRWAMAIGYSNQEEQLLRLGTGLMDIFLPLARKPVLMDNSGSYNCSEPDNRLSSWPEGEQCSWNARGHLVSPLHRGGEDMGYKFGPTS